MQIPFRLGLLFPRLHKGNIPPSSAAVSLPN